MVKTLLQKQGKSYWPYLATFFHEYRVAFPEGTATFKLYINNEDFLPKFFCFRI